MLSFFTSKNRSCSRGRKSSKDSEISQNEINDINAAVMRDLMNKLKEKEPVLHLPTQAFWEEEKGKADLLSLSYICQLAHGSHPIQVTKFSSVDELFSQIAEAYGINCRDIIFCTINTYRVDMNHLFNNCLDPGDIIYAHLRGQPLEVELVKVEESIGITVADNGLQCVFIKRIKENSIAGTARGIIAVGQQIVCIQGQSVAGLRHHEVAKVIQKIPIGQKFVMRLVNPLMSGFNHMQPRNNLGKPQHTNGMGTIRFKANRGVVVQLDGGDKQIIDKLNDIFDDYFGVQDDELAQTVWDTAQSCKTVREMIQKIRDSELNEFGFPDELIFDMWGIASDLLRERKWTN